MNVIEYIDAKLTHSIHTSERLSWRGCRRRHNWIFVDGWYPQTTAKPLEFGQAFHRGMQEWYDPMMWGKDAEARLNLAILAFKRTCEEHKLNYLRSVATSDEEPEMRPEVDEDFTERLELGIGMLRYHCEKVSPQLDVGFKPIQVEIEFEVPITDPDGNYIFCKCDKCWDLFYRNATGHNPPTRNEDPVAWEIRENGRQHFGGLPLTYGGRIDMLAQDDLGRLWIFDWKTAARLTGQSNNESSYTSDDFIVLDDQITSYVWAMWKLGFPVAGFVYHEVKKGFPVEPEPLKNQYKGRWFSTNKANDYEYGLYLRTIEENDPTGFTRGYYDEFLDWLKTDGPRYWSRKQVERNETELTNAGRNIWLEALDIIDPNSRIYPSPGRFACSFCAFREPCIGTNRGEDVEYMLESFFEKRNPRYWEETKPSTESKGGQ